MFPTNPVLLGSAIAGACLTALLAGEPVPEQTQRESSQELSVEKPLAGLQCPLCRVENVLVPVAYGYIMGGPKPTVVDGVTCPPLPYHRGGCGVRSEDWHCNKCRSEYIDLPKNSRLRALLLCVNELKQGSTCRRRAAVYLLNYMNLAETDALPVVAAALDDNDSIVRARAIRALVRGPFQGKPYVYSEDMRIAERLLAKLEDEAASVRESAAGALLFLDLDPATVIPALARVLDDTSPDVRSMAAKAITAISSTSVRMETPPSVAPLLTALLDHESAVVRAAIAESVGQIGREAWFAIPALERLVNDEDRFVRSAAKNSLNRIKPL